MTKKSILHSLIFCLLFFVQSGIYALKIPPTQNKLVNDYAGVLSHEEINSLTEKLKIYNDTTSNEIAVVLISSLEDESLEDLTYQWAREWGIGKAKKDNGVLIFCAMKEHKIRIEVGTGLEPRLVDGLAGSIIRRIMVPEFREGKIYNGLDKAIDEIMIVCSGEFTKDESDAESNRSITFLIILFAVIILIIIILRNKRGGGGGRMGGFGGPPFLFWSGGHGSWNSGGGSGGGFGGFGGGGFSGGGASGSW